MHPTMTDLPSVRQFDMPKRIKCLLESRELVKEQLLQAQTQQAKYYNLARNEEPEFAIGEKVYLSTKNLVMDEGSKKLSDLRTGPFTILKKVGDGAYKLLLPKHKKVNPVFNVALLTRSAPDPIQG